MPLADVLKYRPKTWKEVGDYLRKLGVNVPMTEKVPIVKDSSTKSQYEPVPLNKVGDYCKGEDTNTTLPIQYKGL